MATVTGMTVDGITTLLKGKLDVSEVEELIWYRGKLGNYTLNNVLNTGLYILEDSRFAKPSNQYPEASTGSLAVYSLGEEVALQHYYTGLGIYSRTQINKVWSPWKSTKGERGDQGERGIQGERGAEGPKGDVGTGLTLKGEVATSSQLPTTKKVGDAYIIRDIKDLVVWDGTKWVAGGFPKGIPGDQGEKGEKGDQGIQGIPGDKGPKGEKGDQGIQGIPGDNGPKGEKGDRGIQGERGAEGANGTVGNTFKGVWKSETSYNAGDLVYYDVVGGEGGMYMAVNTVIGLTPDYGTGDWVLITRNGMDAYIWTGTQAQYNALPDATKSRQYMLFVITGV